MKLHPGDKSVVLSIRLHTTRTKLETFKVGAYRHMEENGLTDLLIGANGDTISLAVSVRRPTSCGTCKPASRHSCRLRKSSAVKVSGGLLSALYTYGLYTTNLAAQYLPRRSPRRFLGYRCQFRSLLVLIWAAIDGGRWRNQLSSWRASSWWTIVDGLADPFMAEPIQSVVTCISKNTCNRSIKGIR